MDLEKLIQENRDQFDSMEPLDGHFERFSERLGLSDEKIIAPSSRFSMLKVAAVILVIITGSVIVFDLATRSIREKFASTVAVKQMPEELSEAVQYYDARATAQLREVHKLANSPEQAVIINEDAVMAMNNLDEDTRELQQSLAENPNCERLQAAIIQNQQMKEGIVNNIVNTLNKH
jgi:hypothetical protein